MPQGAVGPGSGRGWIRGVGEGGRCVPSVFPLEVSMKCGPVSGGCSLFP